MPVHQINVNPPDRQPPLSLGSSNNNSPAGGEGLPEWTSKVILDIFFFLFYIFSLIFFISKTLNFLFNILKIIKLINYFF